MKYLVLASPAAALARSEQAYAPFRPAGITVTTAIWEIRLHPVDGRAALAIPDTPDEAGLQMEAGAYAALLRADEAAALLAALPAGWSEPDPA